MLKPLPSRKSQLGVTLMELVIVAVIIGLIAAFGIPTYKQYILKSNRAEAKTALLALAAEQERYYMQNNTYAPNGDLSDDPPVGLGIPAITERGKYTLVIESADQAGFVANAIATGDQAKDTHCATFTINETQTKTATNTDCW